MIAPTSAHTERHASNWRTVVTLVLGNALEWFDYALFGFFAVPIAANFFPGGNESTSIVLTFAVFGLSYLVRPLGALVLGRYADRHGRKPALVVATSLMGGGTAVIAFTPSYTQIGVAAPLLVLLARLLQGFSAGGEFGGATALLCELRSKRRGFLSSWQFAGQALSAWLANLCGFGLSSVLSLEQLTSWGWRIPFVFGLSIIGVAFWLRGRVLESPEFERLNAPEQNSVFSGLMLGRTMLAIGAVIVLTVGTYTLAFVPTFAVSRLQLPFSAAFEAGLVTSTLQVAMIPGAGALSDRFGRLPLALGGAVATLLFSYPACAWLLDSPSPQRLLVFQVLIGMFMAVYAGPLSAIMAESFPTRIRTTGLSLSYAIAVSLFGGFAPLVSQSAIAISGEEIAFIYYLVGAAGVSVLALLFVARMDGRASPGTVSSNERLTAFSNDLN